MKYYQTKTGIIVDENNNRVQMESGNADYQLYLDFLTNNGTVEQTDFEFVIVEVPEFISSKQFWLSVYDILNLQMAQVRTNAETVENPIRILIMLDTSTEYHRHNEELLFMAQKMQIPDSVLDQIFIHGNTL